MEELVTPTCRAVFWRSRTIGRRPTSWLSGCWRKIGSCIGKPVTFCCISTGVFRFPNDRATEIAVQTVTNWLRVHGGQMEWAVFNVFKDEDKILYEKLLAR